MASNILSIGQSALAAAQVGLATAGHNIANAATPGYSRQSVVQAASMPQNFGYGFLGQGTEIATVKRIYSEFLGSQVRATQASKSGTDSYYTQIRQIDNLLADSSAGLSPTLQDFFKGVQELAANPAAVPSRQAMLSSAEALAARFRGLDGRLDEIRQGVSSQISSSVDVINAYAKQIAQLNSAIEKVQGTANDKPANDLLDQRDQLVLELAREIKATVVKQDGGGYNVFIGNGQPLVVGVQAFALKAVASLTDVSRTEVAYVTNGNPVILGEQSLAGGRLGGLIAFRNQSLDPAQNALGRVAIGLASTFNAQHRLGQDINGNPGGDFFTAASPLVSASRANTGTAALTASISDVSQLTTSDYRLQFDGSNYRVTRLTDGAITTFSTFPQTVDGVDFNLASGSPAAGDDFLIRPTANGAAAFGVAITDPARIAAAATPVPPDTSGVGDNRNALLLAALQTSNTLAGGTTTYQGAFAQLVSSVGNKTRELEVTSSAEGKLLAESVRAQQSESGVNLDEEAANLLRYQQAYQAAGKVMQIASQMFDVLLSLGR